MKTILPPNATKLEVAVESVGAARLAGVPVVVDQIWNPATCPAPLLPWLAWGLSLDLWNSQWSEAEKRAAVADAIQFQQRKGTPASLRAVLDRFDPLIEIVEWFNDRVNLAPYTFRLELPLLEQSSFVYDQEAVAQILRDIAQVKPARAHMSAVFRLRAEANAWILSAAHLGGMTRVTAQADVATATDPVWASYLQTANGEPFQAASGEFLGV